MGEGGDHGGLREVLAVRSKMFRNREVNVRNKVVIETALEAWDLGKKYKAVIFLFQL